MTPVFEAEAYFNTRPNIIERLVENGIDIISQPDSFYAAKPDVRAPA